MLSVLATIVALSLLFPPPPEPTWEWPTEGPREVLRDFRAPSTPWGPGHRGLDLLASSERLVAPVSGTISFSGMVAERGVITITTDTGALVSMEPVSSDLVAGSRVSKGEVIAMIEPGHCSERCVHIGLRVDGRYRSPRTELGIGLRSVLLPW